MSNAGDNRQETNPEPGTDFEESGGDADCIEAQANTNAVSRAIAIMILMLMPGVLGSYLDKWLGTQLFIVVGFMLGIGLAIFGLLYVARIADLAAKKSRELRKRVDTQPESSRIKRST